MSELAEINLPMTILSPETCFFVLPGPGVEPKLPIESYWILILSSFNPNTSIASAQLLLYPHPTNRTNVRHSDRSGSNAATIHRLLSTWDETTVTWNTAPNFDPAVWGNIPQTTQFDANHAIDVTSLVQSWVDGTVPNFGMLIKLQTEQRFRSLGWASSRSTNEDLWPVLVIETIEPRQCEVDVLNISTGYDPVNNQLYPAPGNPSSTFDGFWNVISVPPVSGSFNPGGPAFVIEPQPNSGWANQNGSQWISALAIHQAQTAKQS